ncbi:MAG: peptide ABC transporter substrate-binding protein [Parachlamydiales bacterium]
MRRALFLSLLLLVSCQPASKPVQSTLRMAITEDIESFDPQRARSIASQTVCKMLYDGLMRIDEEGRPIPSLAQVISISADKRTYTITLQESLWTDGEPVTAYDFEAAWREALDPETGSENAAVFYPILNARAAHAGELSLKQVGVRAIHAQQLVVQLGAPTPYFLELLAHPAYSPKAPDGKGTNGPFRLASHRLQEAIVLEKNPTYWDADAVQLDGITLKVVPDYTTALYLFEKGELDWIGSPTGNLPQEYAERAQLYTAPVAATLWYKFNTTRPPLDNAKLRKALSLAVDRQALVQHVLKGGQEATASPLPPALQGERRLPAVDIARAKELLKEALEEMGIDELPPITLTYANGELTTKLTQALQEQWRQVLGLKVSLESTEFKTLLSRMGKMDYQMGGAKAWFADFQDPTGFLSLFTHAEEPGEGGLNETGWEDPAYARLIERAEVEVDPAKRAALLSEAEALFMEAMPVLPICDYRYRYQKRDFAGERIPPAGTPDFKWVRRE